MVHPADPGAGPPAGGGDRDLTAAAETLAASLLADAEVRRGRSEIRRSVRLARLLGDPRGRAMVLALTDEVLRISPPDRAAAVLGGLTRVGSNPLDDWRAAAYLQPLDRAALVAGGRLAAWWPAAVIPLVRRRVRKEMAGVILPVDPRRLARHAEGRRRSSMTLNVNLLGEAVLGEDEAERRLGRVMDVLDRPYVRAVSVKITSICSQIDVLAFDAEVERIADRLRRLYRRALRHSPAKLVTLDMEEYRDLDLTTAAFRRVLDEVEFQGLSAGLVLQAYLPDSYGVLEDLARWAARRRDSGGAGVKVRLVKGANLAVEAVEAELSGWEPATFPTKSETDANYKRMLALALSPAWAGALRVGVASHNLFDVAWAALRADAMGATDRVEFEMLEGMSPAVAAAVAARFGRLLLYAPVVEAGDTEAAIAYLVRRLDENSGEGHFLAQFDLRPGGAEWSDQARMFRAAVEGSAGRPEPPSRRRQDRATEVPDPRPRPFANTADTDFTRRANREWAWAHVRRAVEDDPREVRPVVGGGVTGEAADQRGIDPGRPQHLAYMWAPASGETVGRAVEAARLGQDPWRSTTAEERRRILHRVAAGLEAQRGKLLGVMALDTAKTVREGDPEVSEAVDLARYYAEQIPAEGSGFEPYGTVTVASPWNFPLSIPVGGITAALAAGNTVVFKPAPEAVAVGAELARILWASGVPAAALHFVPCLDGEASRELIVSPGVDAVILTGSWETSRMFLRWRPGLDLHAETSGKNSVVITATADPDQAITDLLRSTFGHSGQKCSAASLVVVEASRYDDGRFLRRLADAVRSLRVGPVHVPGTVVGPLIAPPRGPLAAALGHLEEGERWLVEPRRLDSDGYLWSPGVKLGVAPGSAFHLTECFGPVLGVMRAGDLDEALDWQNQPDYGLTAGIQALDPAEVEHWRGRAQAGNLYVNRGITGAVVGRQPFGGWKRSVVGPGAKAGGPNYVASLGRWPVATARASLTPSDFERAWREMARPSDPSGLRSESNVLRYRPLRRVAVMGDDPVVDAAAGTVGAEVVRATDAAGVTGCDKVRVLASIDDRELGELHEAGVWVDLAPVSSEPVRELQRWVREQSVSESRHRHGNVTGRHRGLLPPP